MDKQSIIGIVRELLKVRSSAVVVRSNGWVNIPCPLAKWRHQKGTDNSPSFGIKINDTDVSICHCYTCKYRRPISGLLEDYSGYTGIDLEAEIELAKDGEFLNGTLRDWEEDPYEDVDERYNPEDAIDEGEWDIYDSAVGHPYLVEREIDDETAEELHLMVDPEDSEGEERILFPVWCLDGNVYGMTGRATDPDARLRVRDYQGLKKRLFLLGLGRVTIKWERVILVEGLFDVARLVQYGQPVLGVMGSTLTDAQADWLIELGLPVYTMFDRDDAGQAATQVTITKLHGHLPVLTTTYPHRETWSDKKGDYELVSDPDQLMYDEVVLMIQEAELVC